MLLEALETARDLGRLHEIASVLIRHGLGDVVHRAGIARRLQRAGRALHWRSPERTALLQSPERLRLALEELGPTFIKLGQVLAGRSDMLDREWTNELSKLQEDAVQVPWAELRPRLVEDLGRDPEQVFREIDAEPIAAASIAQVHRARLLDGREVVLKLRRPGIRGQAESDLRLMTRLAEIVEQELGEMRRYRPRSVVRGFARSLRDELDFTIEARSCERIALNLAAVPDVVIPGIHREWTRPRLLVQDYLEGRSVGEWVRAGRPGDVDARRLTERGADAVLKMVFIDGFYHADPHPGNVLLMSEDRIGILDFGMVGRLSDARRIEFVKLLRAVSTRRTEEVVDLLLEWSPNGDCDLDMLSQDCAAFIDRYEGLPLDQIDTPALLRDVVTLVRENDLMLPTEVSMLLKLFLTLDGLGNLLDPTFSISSRVAPFAESALAAQTTPAALMRRGAREVEELAGSIPAALRRAVTRARRGHFKVRLDLERLERFAQQLDRTANRITMGLITASLIIATAVVLALAGGPEVAGLPVFGLLGFISSILIGVWLLASMLRANRR